MYVRMYVRMFACMYVYELAKIMIPRNLPANNTCATETIYSEQENYLRGLEANTS